jgi:hypothetical protein
MTAELPPDEDNSEVLEKLDALLRKHQSPPPPPPKPAAPPPATLLAPTPPETPPTPDLDDIPVLTEIIGDFPPSQAPATQNSQEDTLRALEERLLRELDTRIAPELSLAFQEAMDKLLMDAKLQISAAVREHLNKAAPPVRDRAPD